ncbi:photosystem II D1 precursor processing protein PSB27-H2, chloroplastic-like isoform X1 [Panicum miliaceum]|uniref:Photosystem II D1 processing protein PSB27-H2, chloroplastic-like isoform X1 n=1 Tax=Panicum miliaceum TaxID=4540 RepID=A0A3L6TUB2_PANMI|nr:photosystem II D1 precursor processing protein PSB27-H2, chloroplastic-like isoform X1 [Panicum miliaceum]
MSAASVAAALPEVVARISNGFPSAASDAHAEQVLPLLLVAVDEAAASCGDREEAYLAGAGARLPITRRAHAASLLLGLAGMAVAASAPVRADDESNGGGGGEEEEGVLGAIKSIFDPNEKTKAGKVLPKAYLKAAREVVRTLRESLEEDDGGDMAKFRRNADAAKASIREFLGGWRGQQAVAAEDSTVALEKAIRSLAEFYSKAGPSAPLPQDVKNKILDDLSTADAYL